jgi:hypothetical protein
MSGPKCRTQVTEAENLSLSGLNYHRLHLSGWYIATMEPNRILFLDFDGVLHPTFAAPEDRLMHLAALADALHDVQCEIVISSSWRFQYSLDQLRQLMPLGLRAKIRHCTGDAMSGRHARYEEIKAYLALHCDPVDWRALDDSRYEFPRDCQRVILCDPARGLGEPQIVALRRWAPLS